MAAGFSVRGGPIFFVVRSNNKTGGRDGHCNSKL
jgi:hypothetical protein